MTDLKLESEFSGAHQTLKLKVIQGKGIQFVAYDPIDNDMVAITLTRKQLEQMEFFINEFFGGGHDNN